MLKVKNFVMPLKTWRYYWPVLPVATQNSIETCSLTVEPEPPNPVDERQNGPRCRFFIKAMPSIKGTFIVIVLFSVGVLMIYLTLKQAKCKPDDVDCSGKKIPKNMDKSANKELRVVTRREWKAQPPIGKLEELELPVNSIIVDQTASNNCTTQDTCILQVRSLQTLHMGSQLDDIRYNFLVGGDGVVYEGRGWEKVGVGIIEGSNISSIVIALIGTFTNYPPLKRQLAATKLLLQNGVRLGKVAPNYQLSIPQNSDNNRIFLQIRESGRIDKVQVD